MKHLAKFALPLMFCTSSWGCAIDDVSTSSEPEIASVTSDLVDCHPAVDARIDTAYRDGNLWMIDICIDVLCTFN